MNDCVLCTRNLDPQVLTIAPSEGCGVQREGVHVLVCAGRTPVRGTCRCRCAQQPLTSLVGRRIAKAPLPCQRVAADRPNPEPARQRAVRAAAGAVAGAACGSAGRKTCLPGIGQVICTAGQLIASHFPVDTCLAWTGPRLNRYASRACAASVVAPNFGRAIPARGIGPSGRESDAEAYLMAKRFTLC